MGTDIQTADQVVDEANRLGACASEVLRAVLASGAIR